MKNGILNNGIFLGRLTDWIVLVFAFVVLGVIGEAHIHTSAFNLFAGVCFLIALGAVLAVVLPHKRGDRVTREPIEIPED
jgi:uncharacterized phage infection (PIP) family protein YhgE